MKEMKCRPQLNVFVRELLNLVMEKGDAHRALASQLLRDLLRDGELGKEKFREGCVCVCVCVCECVCRCILHVRS